MEFDTCLLVLLLLQVNRIFFLNIPVANLVVRQNQTLDRLFEIRTVFFLSNRKKDAA